MIQSLSVTVSDYHFHTDEHWGQLGNTLLERGLDGFEILADIQKTWEPIPPALVKGYQFRNHLDWFDCYEGKKKTFIWNFIGRGEAADYFGNGSAEDILNAYRQDLEYGLSLKTPYIIFDVANADEQEVSTFEWKHSDHQIMDAAIEILNILLKGVEPNFYLLLGNSSWPGFTFTDPQKTEYLLSRINYPKVGIMLDTARLLSIKWHTKNQSEAIRYIHSVLDAHGELCKSIMGLHFSYLPTLGWTGSRPRIPEYRPGDYRPAWLTPEVLLKVQARNVGRHSCWTNPECISLIERIEPQYLVHTFHDNGNLTQMGALTRQLKAIRRGRDMKAIEPSTRIATDNAK